MVKSITWPWTGGHIGLIGTCSVSDFVYYQREGQCTKFGSSTLNRLESTRGAVLMRPYWRPYWVNSHLEIKFWFLVNNYVQTFQLVLWARFHDCIFKNAFSCPYKIKMAAAILEKRSDARDSEVASLKILNQWPKIYDLRHKLSFYPKVPTDLRYRPSYHSFLTLCANRLVIV